MWEVGRGYSYLKKPSKSQKGATETHAKRGWQKTAGDEKDLPERGKGKRESVCVHE